MADTGLLIVLSGFAGSGKGSIMKRLLADHPEEYALSVSATTRSPREGETDGREYFFCTKEEFERMITNNELLEYACYVGNYYGTPKAYVREQLATHKNVILEIEIQGALKIKEQFPEALLLFVMPPSAKILRDRLAGRGTETRDVIQKRLRRAVEEAEGCEAYDYLIINDNLEEAAREVHRIIRSERRKMRRHTEKVSAFREELRQLVKGE